MTDPRSGMNSSSRPRVKGDHQETALEEIRSALQGLKFGQVVAVVQDGVVVQIERIEKKRLV